MGTLVQAHERISAGRQCVCCVFVGLLGLMPDRAARRSTQEIWVGQYIQEVLRPESGWWPEGWTEWADCREPLGTERGAREGHLGQSRV